MLWYCKPQNKVISMIDCGVDNFFNFWREKKSMEQYVGLKG